MALTYLLDELNYNSVAEFFFSYLQPIPRGSGNTVVSPRHRSSLKLFLQGQANIKPVNIVERMFDHRYSYPSPNCVDKAAQRDSAYSPSLSPNTIRYSRCSLSSWAVQKVGDRVYRDVEKLIYKNHHSSDSDVPSIQACLLASANDRTKAKGARTVTKEDLLGFKLMDRVSFFKNQARLAWYLTECMAHPRKKSALVERKRRPPHLAQIAAISSFVMARNQYANGFLAMQLGIWHFACHSHIDVTRIYCHMAGIVHKTTSARALAR
ncbi:hypothetical protein K435DRAFT_655980 [Dendrothele bispora CBS 962.96]|uniref:Uncharacterized protein n=1 Tax=Dendrothele bispora (strain CBS 962.96) TaxID=1314807 RepID=A0A4S8MET7_DENBC|nr:hypothetical protein K435DRAFT_655980 [Dendrothele bispora CBS 962.96]